MFARVTFLLCMVLLSVSQPLTLSALTIATSGSVAGEWTADLQAARDLARANNTYYLINFGQTYSCNYCNAAKYAVWETQEFKDWAKNNGIPLVYANRESTSTEPGVTVKNLYPGLQYYPTILIIDGAAPSTRLIGKFVFRLGNTYNNITINLTPSNFFSLVDSYTKPAAVNDAWDSTATVPGDEAWTNATALAMTATNRLHGAHTLKNSDTADWFAFTNLVAGQRYRVATTNVTVLNAVAKLSLYSDGANAGADVAWTNLPLSAASAGLYFMASSTGAGYAKASRGVTNNADVTYKLAYRQADPTPRALTVNNGVGTVETALEGQDFAVAANAAVPGQNFVGWAVNPAGAFLGAGFNAALAAGVVTMPAYAVTLTAQYQAETRIIALTGDLAFGSAMTNRTAQRTLTVANTGNATLTVTDIVVPNGFTVTPTNFTVASGASRPVTVAFSPTEIQDYTGTVAVASDKTAGGDTVPCSGKGIDNLAPVVTARSPTGNPAAINEGASLAFSAMANDSTDPDTAARGMVSITWQVDGVEKQVSTSGAPNAITSAYTFSTDTSTVQGLASNHFTVTAIALDKQGGRTETSWTVWVLNAQASQTITFPVLPVKGLGDGDFSPGATASSSLAVQYTSSNELVAQIVGGLIHLVGAGSATITASQPGNADFRAASEVKRTLTVRVRVAAVASPVEGGTVSGGGTYAIGARLTLTARPAAGYTFLRWENGLQTATRSVVVGSAPLDATAFFGLTASVQPPVLANPGPQSAMVGVQFNLPLDLTSDSLPTVRVVGLPTGLRYDSASNVLAGVPTVAVTGKTVTVTAKNVNPAVVTQAFDIAVENLPQWAWGTFNGWCDHDVLGLGSVSMTISSAGRVSGKLALAGTNYTFSANAYSRLDGDGTLWLTVQAAAGRGVLPLTFKVYQLVRIAAQPPVVDDSIVPDTLSVVEGWFGGVDADPADAALYRDVWKDAGMSSVITNYVGYYTATLPVQSEVQPPANASLGAVVDVPAGSAYLTFTVDKLGVVRTVGKLADGTAVSLSSTLIVDDSGRLWTVLYTSPATYRGGVLFGIAEFVKPTAGAVFVRLLDGVPFEWANRNPQATGVYDAGFERTLGLVGGWYDKVSNLYAYYAGKVLTVGVGETGAVPALNISTNRYESDWWNPDGLQLSVLTNTLGVLTGLKAPAAGTPTYTGGEWVYDATNNTVGLSLTLARATGLFSGSYKAWFDFGATHTYKTITLLGAITPVRENTADNVEGRGFFQSSDRSSYLNPANRPVPYTFYDSYDFVIESGPQN
jgi:hypothetical protein